jgi:cell growth-regulating nucleolar protein
MPSFVCDDCQSTVKKAKLDNHVGSCGTRSFSCIDCGVCFGGIDYRYHTQCITEAEKYEKKPAATEKRTVQAVIPEAKKIPAPEKENELEYLIKKYFAKDGENSLYEICKKMKKDEKKKLLKSVALTLDKQGKVSFRLK